MATVYCITATVYTLINWVIEMAERCYCRSDLPVRCTPSQVATGDPSAEYVSQIKRRVEDDTTARKVHQRL